MRHRGNLCDNLLRRSVENQFMTFRHNRREREMLNDKFADFHRQIRLVENNINMAERRFEKRVTKDLGFMIKSREIELQPSPGHQFYYPTTLKSWTLKEFTVEPMKSVIERQNRYRQSFENRRQNYGNVLRRKARSFSLRKQDFLEQTDHLVREDFERSKHDWPCPEHARLIIRKVEKPPTPRRLPSSF